MYVKVIHGGFTVWEEMAFPHMFICRRSGPCGVGLFRCRPLPACSFPPQFHPEACAVADGKKKVCLSQQMQQKSVRLDGGQLAGSLCPTMIHQHTWRNTNPPIGCA